MENQQKVTENYLYHTGESRFINIKIIEFLRRLEVDVSEKKVCRHKYAMSIKRFIAIRK